MSEENLLEEILIELDYIHDYVLISVLLNVITVVTILLMLIYQQR